MRDTIEIVKQIKEEGFAPVLLFPETRRLIELVRADEREACANLLDSTDLSAMSADPKLQNWTAALLFQYAAAIRARGETK
jgi:hypothetical protein